MQELKQGTPLQGGKYIIKRVLGQGGFGITYLAEQVSLGREVAIKEFFMKDNCVRNEASSEVSVPTTGSAAQVEQYRKKFMKEARMLAGFVHPNIVNVIDVFEENGTVYYSMPYYAGGSLKDLVLSRGRLLEEEAMRYVQKIASALKYMHQEKHVCHFDVKPDNILFDINGNPALIDFGISKNYDDKGNETSSTPVGMSEGYAPIEQYQQMVNEFSPASDVYALGATLFFMLTGTKPPTAVSLVQGMELPFNEGISHSLQSLIKRTMSVAIRNRPQEVDDFLDFPDGAHGYVDITQAVNANDPVVSDETVINSALDQCRPNQNNPIIKQLLDDMVLVEGGTFQMGKNTLFYSDANPKHNVTLTRFYICKYQVTQEIWETVMGNNPSKFRGGAKSPVECVSWNDCQEFIIRLNKLTGINFRLPTEAEWEYAACGGERNSSFRFSGSDSINMVAWYSGNCKSTQNVGLKAPNNLGLYDMSGNVWEWCQDGYGSYTDAAEYNPKGNVQGSYKVIRGGSWKSPNEHCRVKQRGRMKPSAMDDDLGLRLLMDAK